MQDIILTLVNGSNGPTVLQLTMYDTNFINLFYGLSANILIIL